MCLLTLVWTLYGATWKFGRLLVLDGSLSPEKLKQIQLLTIVLTKCRIACGNCRHLALEFEVFRRRCFLWCFIVVRRPWVKGIKRIKRNFWDNYYFIYAKVDCWMCWIARNSSQDETRLNALQWKLSRPSIQPPTNYRSKTRPPETSSRRGRGGGIGGLPR